MTNQFDDNEFDDDEEVEVYPMASSPFKWVNIPLYFIGTLQEAKLVAAGQFTDIDHEDGKRGVLLVNMPNRDEEGPPADKHLVRVTLLGTLSLALFREYEVVKLENTIRQFIIPAADLLQEDACTVEYLSHEDWDEQWHSLFMSAWNEYPPFEPMETLSKNLRKKFAEFTAEVLPADKDLPSFVLPLPPPSVN